MDRMRLRRTLGIALLAGVVGLSGCIVLELGDVKDIARGGLSVSTGVRCAAEDQSAVCLCEERCVAEATDCYCAVAQGPRVSSSTP